MPVKTEGFEAFRIGSLGRNFSCGSENEPGAFLGVRGKMRFRKWRRQKYRVRDCLVTLSLSEYTKEKLTAFYSQKAIDNVPTVKFETIREEHR